MKVLVLSPSLASVGGIQRYTTTLIRALKDELGDQSVRCITIAEASHGNRVNGTLPIRAKLSFAYHAFRDAWRWKPDLIICTHLALGPIAWSLSISNRLPYWIVVYGIEAWISLSCEKRNALRRAGRVLAISTFTEEQVAKRQQINSGRMARLPCALDDTLLSIEPSRNGHFSFSNEQPIILTVGRMATSERYKGHDVVLRTLPPVVAKVPKVMYLVVGDGDDRPCLEALAKDLGVAQHVIFTGEVSDSELAEIYRRSSVFVLPARTVMDDRDPKGEGFGIVFLEAMAFEKPVIGPNYGAPAELIRDGENGLLIDPEDPTSVGEALVKLLSNPDMAMQMGKTGSEWVSTQYSYDCFRNRLRELLSC